MFSKFLKKFWVLRDYIGLNFAENFEKVIKLMVRQFQSADHYKGKFNGFEWAGGGISQSGGHFSITDRHFVMHTLKPALNNLYKSDRAEAWKFVIENCISREEKEITKDKPDFLNRASIDILLSEYKDGENKKEAFKLFFL